MSLSADKKSLSLIRNSLWNVSSRSLGILAAFFLTPFVMTKIGTEHYGLYMLLMSISGMMGMMNLGLGEATLRYVSYYHKKNDMARINRTVSSTLLVYLVMGAVGGCLLFFGAETIIRWLSIRADDGELAVSVLRLTALNFGFSFIVGVYATIPQAILRFDVTAKITAIQCLFQAAGTVVLLQLGYGLYHLVLWSVVTVGFTQLTNIIVAKALLPGLRLRPSISLDGLREVFGYGVFSSVNGMISLASQHIDRILLAVFIGPAAVAFVAVPRHILERASALHHSLAAVLFPKISGTSDVEEIRRLYGVSTWALLTFTMALLAPGVLLMPRFLAMWINPEFARSSGYVGQLLAVAFAFRGISEPYFAVLRGTGRIRVLTVIFMLSSLLGVVVAVPLLYYAGVVGAGYRALTVVGISVPISLWVNRAVLMSKHNRRLGSLIAAPVVASLVALVILRLTLPFWHPNGLLGLAGLWGMSTALIVVFSVSLNTALIKDDRWAFSGICQGLRLVRGRILRSVRS